MSFVEIDDFKEGKLYAQALYERIPKPELARKSQLSRQDTSTYLRRLERLHTTCPGQFKFRVHYPAITDQKPNSVVQNYVFDPSSQQFGTVNSDDGTLQETSQLSPKQKQAIRYQRSDAIIAYSQDGCRAKENIANPHFEILFVLAISSDVAVQVMDELIGNFKSDDVQKAVFVEVPSSWDAYFQSAGFKQFPATSFGTLLPAHSFLHTWKIDQLEDAKSVTQIYETTPGLDLKYPDDSDLSMPPKDPLRNVLFANMKPYSNTNAQEAKTKFFNDKDMLIAFGKNSQGTISVADAEQIRKILVQMFEFAQTAKSSQVWSAMLEVERMFGEFGIIATPSAQTWFTDVMQRNDKNEIVSKLPMLRGFVSLFPRFAPQQIRVEYNMQSVFSPKERDQSRVFIRNNLTEPSDFEYVSLESAEAMKSVHARMLELRRWWTMRVNTLVASASALEATKAQDKKKEEEEEEAENVAVDSSIAMRKKGAEIVQNGIDMEHQFRATLKNLLPTVKNQANKLSIEDWLQESEISEQNLQALSVSVASSSSSSSSSSSPLPVSKVVDTFAQTLLNNNDKLTGGKGEEDDLKQPEPASPEEFQDLIAQVNANLAKLIDAEKQRKSQIRGRIKRIAQQGLGASNDIKKLSNNNVASADIPAQYQQQRQDLIRQAQGCLTNLIATAANPHIELLSDAAAEASVTESELVDLHNIVLDNTKCLTKYYAALQILDKNIKADSEVNDIAQNELAAKQINDNIRKANIAISTAEALFQKMTATAYVKKTDDLERSIDTMRTQRNEMQTLSDAFSAVSKEPNAIFFTKKEREDKLQRSNQLLVSIVRLGLEFRGKFLDETEQGKLIYAMHNSSKQIEKAKERAQQSAELAERHLKELRVQELAGQQLAQDAAVVSSRARNVSASFDQLDKTRQNVITNHRVRLMELITQLEMSVDSKTSTHRDLIDGLKNLQEFFAKYRRALDIPEMNTEKERMGNVVKAAKQKLDNLVARPQLPDLTEVESVSFLFDSLKVAVEAGNVQRIRFILSQLAQHKAAVSTFPKHEDLTKLMRDARSLVRDSL